MMIWAITNGVLARYSDFAAQIIYGVKKFQFKRLFLLMVSLVNTSDDLFILYKKDRFFILYGKVYLILTICCNG